MTKTAEKAEDDVEFLLSKWNDMDDLTMTGLLILRNVINKEITVRKSNCSLCKNKDPKGCDHCHSDSKL